MNKLGRPPVEEPKEIYTVRIRPSLRNKLKDAGVSFSPFVERAIEAFIAEQNEKSA